MSKRDQTLDFMRVLAMFLVIVIHLANCYCREMDSISNASYLFACLFNGMARVSVPIFFMISGALLIPKKQSKEKYLNRIKKMVIVLGIWTLVYLIWQYFFSGIKPDNILALFFNPERAHLWFMYAIITIYIALPFISKMAKNLTKKEEDLFIILWLFFNGICYVLKLMIGTSITYQVPIISGTYYLGYFLIGHIIYKRYKNYKEKEKLKDYNKLLLLTFIASNAIILIVTLIMSEVTGTYYKKYFTYINIFTVLNSLSVFIYILINLKDLKPNISNFINKVAPYSLGIYLIHGIFLDILKKLINLNSIPSLIAIPIFTCVLFIISYFSIKGLKQIPKINKYIC